MQAIIFIGIQATGKSTFCAQHFANTHVRINLDMLRTRHRERLLLDACVEGKQPFVIDNTNPTPADRAYYIAPAKEAGFEVVGYYFRSSAQESLHRNALRPALGQVPERGVRGTAARLQLPRKAEGFDVLYYVRHDDSGGFVVEEWRDEV